MKITQSLLSWRSFHGKNIQSLLRFPAWAFLPSAAAILALLLSTASSSFSGSATWKASPASGDWNTAGNWTPRNIPNGPSDTATFAGSSVTDISLSANTEVSGIVFDAGASPFTINIGPGFVDLTISGVGVTNNSGMQQNFITDNDASGAGLMKFTNNATAGSSTVFANNSGAFLEFHDASSADHGVFINSELGHTRFFDSSTADHGTFVNNGAPPDFLFAPGITDFFGTSTAANAIITNNGATSIGASGGLTNFFDSSTTDNATLIANGGSNVGSGAAIYFYQDSIGGTARVEVFGNGTGDFTNGALDISFHSAPGVTTGSIEGSGVVFLGANKLTVGSNNLTTTFSGVIQDGGLNGGTGGSLTKIGKGKVTLSNASTYTGGTTITKGTLLVTNRTGSGTGTAAVQVNTGTLGGTGKITGAVTVGTGTSSGPIVLPGKSATKPGTLTINSALTFNSRSTYKCVLDRSTLIAGKVSALGVTINSGASFTFVDIGTGTLTVGTVFTVINNTSASPIAGTFSNLANGAVFTSNGNNFQASYTGGTGNDLTLTVVP